MTNPSGSGEKYDGRVVDNAVILLSLLVMRWELQRHHAVFPPKIRKGLMMRVTDLIRRYKNPENGIEFQDPEDVA